VETELSENAQFWLRRLGRFCPTVRAEEKLVKGYLDDDEGGGKAYLDVDDLRSAASALVETADFLERRSNNCGGG
jgi:hypothetical protein